MSSSQSQRGSKVLLLVRVLRFKSIFPRLSFESPSNRCPFVKCPFLSRGKESFKKSTGCRPCRVAGDHHRCVVVRFMWMKHRQLVFHTGKTTIPTPEDPNRKWRGLSGDDGSVREGEWMDGEKTKGVVTKTTEAKNTCGKLKLTSTGSLLKIAHESKT